MALNDDTKEIAKKLGLSVPNGLSEQEILSSLASQVGFDDYNDDEQSDIILNNILHNMDADNQYGEADDYIPQDDSASLNDFDDGGSSYQPYPFGRPVRNGYNKNVGENNNLNGDKVSSPDSTNKEADPSKKDDDENKKKNENDEAAKALTGPAALANGASENQAKGNNEANPGGTGKDSVPVRDNSPASRIRSNMNGSEPFGNGYSKDSHTNSKRDELNRKNFSFGKKMKEGRAEEEGTSSKGFLNKFGNKKSGDAAGTSSGSDGSSSKKSGGIKGRVGSLLSKTSNIKEGASNPFRMAARAAFGALKHFLLTNPFAWFIIGFLILFLLILFVCLGAGSSGNSKKRNSGTQCTYDLRGVTNTGNVSLDDVKVELVNCDATQGNYTVLETIDFEKYTLGVALAEIGPNSPDEAIKAQIVAARNFALTRNSGMCPGNPDSCFYGYNTTTKKIRMRACEQDQVYWESEKDIYRLDRGKISIYSPEIKSGTLWKSALSEQRKTEVLALAEDVKGKVLLDSTGNVYATSYNSTKSSQFINMANEGKSYEQILQSVYNVSDFSSAKCHSNSAGNIDYGDYTISSDGNEILHQDLSSFLSSKGTSLEEFNSLIEKNVKKAGYGTRAGVVAAAVTLIAELGNNYQVKIPYYWGGGHEGPINDYAKANWGSTACHTYANSQSYNYCGFDCSGFVSWTIHNGGFNMSWAILANQFQNMSGVQKVGLTDSAVLEPGDLLESNGHIVLIVGIDEETKHYICAEAMGNTSGVLFTKRGFSSPGYWGVKMDGYYNNSANVRG